MTDVVIAGAGVGGLCAALALAEAGATVTVLDEAPVLREVGAGLQLAPNATRVLARLGLLDRLSELAVKPEGVRIRRGRDGTDLARFAYGASAESRYGAPFLVMHRADLQHCLAEAARACSRIHLTLGTRVEGFVPDGTGVRVSFRRGSERSTVSTRGLVGAD